MNYNEKVMQESEQSVTDNLQYIRERALYAKLGFQFAHEFIESFLGVYARRRQPGRVMTSRGHVVVVRADHVSTTGTRSSTSTRTSSTRMSGVVSLCAGTRHAGAPVPVSTPQPPRTHRTFVTFLLSMC